MLRLEFDGNKLKDAKDARGSLLLLTLEPSESQEELWERVQCKCRSSEDLPKPVKFIVELKEPAKEWGSVARAIFFRLSVLSSYTGWPNCSHIGRWLGWGCSSFGISIL